MKIIKENIKLILLIFIISVPATFIVYKILYKERVQYITVDYNISLHKIGFNLDSNMIHFGTLMPSTTGERTLEVSSDYNALVMFEVVNISYIVLDYNKVTIPKDEKFRMRISAIIPQNASLGYYKGAIKIISQRIPKKSLNYENK